LLEIFFIWTGFKPAARKDDEFSAKRSMQPLDVCLLKEFGTAVCICLKLIWVGTNLLQIPFVRAMFNIFSLGSFCYSDLEYEIRNRNEVILKKLRSAGVTIQKRTM